MFKAYLTLDDSPSHHTKKLVDHLTQKNIPAILFVRGALMEDNCEAIVYAIRNGLHIGNHSYAHSPAGDMGFETWCDDFERCETLIEEAYQQADKTRKLKLFRFPYIDRGDGQKTEQIDHDGIIDNEQTLQFQTYLRQRGFAQPFINMADHYPIEAADCLYTYTARDWMLNVKHRGHHDIKTQEDLKTRAEQQMQTWDHARNQALLLHDQDGMVDDAIALIDYFCEKGVTFLDF